MLLLDTNVWLALTFDTHVNHPSAKVWFDGLTTEVCCFCRMTQQGFLRLATNKTASGPGTLTLDEAWNKYDLYLSDPRVVYIDEPAGIEAQWRIFTAGRTFSTHVWNDAYLAAFAVVVGLHVITFDRGFTRYAGVTSTILPP